MTVLLFALLTAALLGLVWVLRRQNRALTHLRDAVRRGQPLLREESSDGGLPAWNSVAWPLNSEAVRRHPTAVAARFDAEEIVYTDTLQKIQQDVVLLDARAAPRYRGEVEPIDPVAGHVPGARNRPFSDNLAADGKFKPAAVLREEFSRLIAPNFPEDVVHMCGSGVTACHNLLAMEHAGLAGSRIYAPSWSGWIADPTRPIERSAA